MPRGRDILKPSNNDLPNRLDGLLAWAVRLLRQNKVDSPALSARLLAAEALSLEADKLIRRPDICFSKTQKDKFIKLAGLRAAGCPVAYLLGRKEFFGLEFQVGPEVLIPRPESEHLLEEALRIFTPEDFFFFADLGSGSGALAVALASCRPKALGVALDISPKALKTALRNALKHHVAGRLVFAQADFSQTPAVNAVFDLIISNPPYISEAEYPLLDREVRLYEPKTALVPFHADPIMANTVDGLAAVRALLPEAKRILKPSGLLLVEIGCDQRNQAVEAALKAGFTAPRILPDLAGRDRILAAVA